MRYGEGDWGWDLPSDLCQRHDLDLESLLAGVLYQGFDTVGNCISNPIFAALRAYRCWDVSYHDHSKAEIRRESRGPQLLLAATEGAIVFLVVLHGHIAWEFYVSNTNGAHSGTVLWRSIKSVPCST